MRRAFAFRYYDPNNDGFFQTPEANEFLNSWKLMCQETMKRASNGLFQVYSLKKEDMKRFQNPDFKHEVQRLDKLYANIEAEVERYTEDIFRFFGTRGKMTFAQFTNFTDKAPMSVIWLTELGTYLEQKLPKMVGMNFEDTEKPLIGSELSVRRMRQTFGEVSSGGVMNELMFEKFVRTKLGVPNKQFARLLFRVMDTSKNGSLSCDEFVDSFTTVLVGQDSDRQRIAFELHDVQGDHAPSHP